VSTTHRPPFPPPRSADLFGRASDDPRWRDVHRHIELAQASALAADLLKSLEPRAAEGPELAGRVLKTARGLGPAARSRLAEDVFRARQRPLPALIHAAFPLGSEGRLRLGHVLLGSAARRSAGVPIRLLEAALESALAEFQGAATEAPASPPVPADPPKARFVDGNRIEFDEEGLLPEVPLPKPPPRVVVAEEPPAQPADRVLLPRVQAATGRLDETIGQIKRTRLLLSQIAAPGLFEAYGVRCAHALLERAQFRASVARELLRACRTADRIPGFVFGARVEVAHLREDTLAAAEILRSRTARGHALGPTPGDLGQLDRRVRDLHAELSQLQAKSEAVGAAGDDPHLGLNDLASLGCAYDPARGSAQILWDEPHVEALIEHGRRLGALREQHARRHDELAVEAAREDASGPRAEAGTGSPLLDLMGLLKRAGVDLARVDPLQLAAAGRALEGRHGRERRKAVARFLEAFRVLATVGVPSLPRTEALRLLRLTLAALPTLDQLSDADVQDKLLEVASWVNAGPGPAVVKLGAGVLRFTVNGKGRVERVSYEGGGAVSALRDTLRGLAHLLYRRLYLRSAPLLDPGPKGRPRRPVSGDLAFAAYRLAVYEGARAQLALGEALLVRQTGDAARIRVLAHDARARIYAAVVAGGVAAMAAAGRFGGPRTRRRPGGRPKNAGTNHAGLGDLISGLDAHLRRPHLPPEARSLAGAIRLDVTLALTELGLGSRGDGHPDRPAGAQARLKSRRSRIESDLRRLDTLTNPLA
jgi:hypothetical protein